MKSQSLQVIRSWWLPWLLWQGIFVGVLFVVAPHGWVREASALSTGQRVRFWFYESGQRVQWTGQVLALSGSQVRVRYQRHGQLLSIWVPRGQVVGLSGTGNLVYTCRQDSKIYYTRTRRRVCCPPTATGYHTRSGGDVICCPAGTVGIYSGQHHVLCQQRGGGSTYVRPNTTHIPPQDACPRGHTLYRAKNGKGFCCPPGTAGYYLGNYGITCRPVGTSPSPSYPSPRPTYGGDGNQGGQVTCPRGYQAYLHRSTQRRFCCPPGSRGNTLTGQCSASGLKPCPPINDSGHTAASCVRFRGTTWKCWYQERPGGSSDKPCQRCACKW